MDPQTIKAVWGDLTVQKDRAQYIWLLSWQHMHRKACPAFGIYGHDVQTQMGDRDPGRRTGKIIAVWPVLQLQQPMRGKSYLQIGSICMGIGGSIIDSDFIESYLGMRVES